MVIRELEGDMARQAVKKTNDVDMLRTMDCFSEGICFVDISSEKWQALHSNTALVEVRFAPVGFCTVPELTFWQRACDLTQTYVL